MAQVKLLYEIYGSGLLATLVIAIAAMFLSDHYGAPTMLFALLLGIALNFLSDHEKCAPGIDLAAKKILRIGVALLGFRISFEAVAALGLWPVVLVVVGVFATMAVGLVCARFFNRSNGFGCLTGGAVGICGASAAMALSSVLPLGKNHERDTIFTVITVTAFSTIAMVVYPIIAELVGLNDRQAGIFLGTTIHDVAQVVGAGYGISDETGDISTIIKLLRVAMLLPVVIGVMVIVRLRYKAQQDRAANLPFPWFILGFIALVSLNSTLEIPAPITGFFTDLSRWTIVMAVAALGMKTSFKALSEVGYVPVLIILVETNFLAALALGVIMIFEL